jgi:hypothetical protein
VPGTVTKCVPKCVTAHTAIAQGTCWWVIGLGSSPAFWCQASARKCPGSVSVVRRLRFSRASSLTVTVDGAAAARVRPGVALPRHHSWQRRPHRLPVRRRRDDLPRAARSRLYPPRDHVRRLLRDVNALPPPGRNRQRAPARRDARRQRRVRPRPQSPLRLRAPRVGTPLCRDRDRKRGALPQRAPLHHAQSRHRRPLQATGQLALEQLPRDCRAGANAVVPGGEHAPRVLPRRPQGRHDASSSMRKNPAPSAATRPPRARAAARPAAGT